MASESTNDAPTAEGNCPAPAPAPSAGETTTTSTEQATSTSAANATTATAAPSVTSPKTIFLIRHAESEENRRLASLGRVFKSLSKFKMPSREDRSASVELLDVGAQLDSDVSAIGAQQIAHMGEKLKDADFVAKSEMSLVVHSQLIRAKETSRGLLQCLAPDVKAPSVGRVEELELLNEKEVKEWIPTNTKGFKNRIVDFERWLASQPDTIIAVVGHSQYFRAMLGLEFRFNNCDVWQVTFDAAAVLNAESLPVSDPDDPDQKVEAIADSVPPDESGADVDGETNFSMLPQWSNLKKLYTCEILGSKEESVV